MRHSRHGVPLPQAEHDEAPFSLWERGLALLVLVWVIVLVALLVLSAAG